MGSPAAHNSMSLDRVGSIPTPSTIYLEGIDMSIRTVVEVNHDYGHHIEEDPAEFARLVRYAINAGDRNTWEELESFGIRFITERHHSDECEVRTKYKTINL